MSPQPQPDMSEGDQDPRFVTLANEQAKDAAGEKVCQNAETIDDPFDKVIGAIHPKVLAAIKAEGADLGEFTMDNMDLESWQIDIPLSPDRATASTTSCHSGTKNKIRITRYAIHQQSRII